MPRKPKARSSNALIAEMEPELRQGVLAVLAAVAVIAEHEGLCRVCLMMASACVIEAAVEAGETHHLDDMPDEGERLH